MTVAIVGGGIVGTSVAYHLATAGVDATLFDRRDAGRATDAGAGILAPVTSSTADSEPWVRFALDAVAYYERLDEQLRAAGVAETGYGQPGLVQIASDEEAAAFDAAVERIRDQQSRLESAPEIFDLDPVEAADQCPALATPARALWYPAAARVDGRTFTAAMEDAAVAAGLETVAADVTDIRVDSGTVTGVVADGERVPADAVVVAGGAWSPELGYALDFEIPVEPMRGQLLHLDSGYDTGDWPVVKGTRSFYMVPWDDGHVAVGATYEEGSGYAPHATVAGIHEVLSDALAVLPGLADAAIRERRVGLRPGSADGLPVCGAVPGVEGAYVATGHGPTGLTAGPYSGRQVARLVAGESVETDMSAFAPSRFA
jgi:D-amino-acid dehydrogenase